MQRVWSLHATYQLLHDKCSQTMITTGMHSLYAAATTYQLPQFVVACITLQNSGAFVASETVGLVEGDFGRQRCETERKEDGAHGGSCGNGRKSEEGWGDTRA